MSPCVNWRRVTPPPRIVNCVRVLGRAAAREPGARDLYAPRCAYVLVRCAVASGERPVGVCALDEGPGKTLRAIAVAGLLTTRHLAAINGGGLDVGEVLDFFRDADACRDAGDPGDRAMLQACALHLLSGEPTR